MIYLLATGFVLSWVLTWFLRRYALARNMLDVPNHRSSHEGPMPRGGGLSFVIGFLILLPFLEYSGWMTLGVSMVLMSAGFLIAALGFWDDYDHISVIWRLLGHFSACLLALYLLGGMPSIVLLGWTFPSGFWLNSLAMIYLAWLVNLYNFMDGIDGLAAMEAFSVCLGSVLLYWLTNQTALVALPLILAAVVAGFLVWNFPQARIFMGDAGSGFLGMALGILSIQAASVHEPLFWSWLILLGVFIVDATVTLLRRMLQGDKLHEAHCSHAYQHATRLLNNHWMVTIAVLVINVFWLFPIAVVVGQGRMNGLIGLLVAYLPLIGLAFQLNAGRVDEVPQSLKT